MNRDDQKSRYEENELFVGRASDGEYCYPVDRNSQGTWMGTHSSGVTIALLNSYPEKAVEVIPTRSRGLIIPYILQQIDGSTNIIKLIQNIDINQYNPFRLAVFDYRLSKVWEFVSNGMDELLPIQHNAESLCLVSSSIEQKGATLSRRLLVNRCLVDVDQLSLEEIKERLVARHVEKNTDLGAHNVFVERPEIMSLSTTSVILKRSGSIHLDYQQNYSQLSRMWQQALIKRQNASALLSC